MRKIYMVFVYNTHSPVGGAGGVIGMFDSLGDILDVLYATKPPPNYIDVLNLDTGQWDDLSIIYDNHLNQFRVYG